MRELNACSILVYEGKIGYTQEIQAQSGTLGRPALAEAMKNGVQKKAGECLVNNTAGFCASTGCSPYSFRRSACRVSA